MRLKKNNSAPVLFPRIIVLLAFFFFHAIAIHADPLNFMIGPLTFVRPPEWKWKEPEVATKASAELLIIDPTTQVEAQVLFSFSPSTPEGVMKRWKGYFAEPPPVEWKTTTNHIQNFTVTYLAVTGTQRSKAKLRPDYSLLGAIIETPKGNVYGRLLGPKNMVQKLTVEFKKMVEAALHED